MQNLEKDLIGTIKVYDLQQFDRSAITSLGPALLDKPAWPGQ